MVFVDQQLVTSSFQSHLPTGNQRACLAANVCLGSVAKTKVVTRSQMIYKWHISIKNLIPGDSFPWAGSVHSQLASSVTQVPSDQKI